MIVLSRKDLSEGSCCSCNLGELSKTGNGLDYLYSEVTHIKFCGYNLNTVVRLCDNCLGELSQTILQQAIAGSEDSTQTCPDCKGSGNDPEWRHGPEYLSDGVYGDYSNGDLRLYTDNGVEQANEIFINSDVLTCMFKYIERCLSLKISVAAQNSG